MKLHLIATFGLTFFSPLVQAEELSAGSALLSDTRIAIEGVGLQPSERPGAFLGGGPNYQVHFDSREVRFTPALGRGAARTESVGFSFLALERGGVTVAQLRGADPVADAERVQFARGGGVVERWDLLREGVELSYLVPQRPAGHGDLVARLAVDSTLGEPIPCADGGLRFVNAKGQGVAVGEVFGVDCNGVRVDGELRFRGGALELVLPHRFVESAAYPLVIDPVIGNPVEIASSDVWDEQRPDVSFDATTESYLVVWERAFASDSILIRGQRVDSVGAPIGGTIFFPFTGVSTRPQVASLNTPDHWVVVWQSEEDLNPGARWTIRLATVNAKTGSIAHTAEVASSTTGAQGDPDVGGAAIAKIGLRSDAMVVWRDSALDRIRGRRYGITSAGTLDTGSSFTIVADGAIGPVTHLRPRISKTCGLKGRYLVVYERYSANFAPNIVGRVVRQEGSVESGTISIADSSAPEYDVDVDGLDTRFTAVWTRDSVSPGLAGVEARTIDYSTDTLTAALQPVVTLTTGFVPPMYPAVGYGAATTSFMWRTTSDIGGFVLVGGRNSANCGECDLNYFVGSVAVDASETLAVATAYSGGAFADDRGLGVWSTTKPGLMGVYAMVLTNNGGGGTLANKGGGCGEGGAQKFASKPAIGSNQFVYTLDGLPANCPVSVLNISVPGSGALSCGPCVSNPLQTTYVVPTQPSTALTREANFGTSIPCIPGLVGITFDVQWTSVTPTASPCSLFPGFSVSDIYRLTIGD